MTPLAWLFLLASWSLILGLNAWCIRRVIRPSGPRAPRSRRSPR